MISSCLQLADCDSQRKPFEESKTPSKAILPAIKDGGLSAGADDYYQKVAIQTLLGILKDPSLNTHHHGVIEAIMSMFKTQGLKCVAFLPQVSLYQLGLK